MTDPDTKLMHRLTRDVERAQHRVYRAEADSFAMRVVLRIVGIVGAVGVLAVASALVTTIDAHTGHQLAQWFGNSTCQ